MKRVLIGLCAVLLLVWTWQWRGWPPGAPSPPPAPVDGEASAEGLNPPALTPGELGEDRLPGDYLTVAERPLFRPDRRPPPEQPEVDAEAEPQAEPSELKGVDVVAILIAAPGPASVWLRAPDLGPAAQRFRLGDDFQGWEIAQIMPEFVQLKGQGRTERLPLMDFTAPPPAAGQQARRRSTRQR